MLITVAEWMQFETEAWPEGYSWCEGTLLDDGTDLYDQDTGRLNRPVADTFSIPAHWSATADGGGSSPLHPLDRGHGVEIRDLVRDWREGRGTEPLVLIVPKGQADAVRAIASERGWIVR